MTSSTTLWTPSPTDIESTELHRYLGWLGSTRGWRFIGYEDLYRWSIDHLEEFWTSIWDYFGLPSLAPQVKPLSSRHMPGTRWFEGAELNYASLALGSADGSRLAIVARRENCPERVLTYGELRQAVGAAAKGLQGLGVGRGDRVAALMPNCPEAVIGLLATASIGAIWSLCPPEFGKASIVDRWSQIEPRVLLAIDGYEYGGKQHKTLDLLTSAQDLLPGLKHLVVVGYQSSTPDLAGLRNARSWESLLQEPAEPDPVALPFEHPLWLLFSSGTTGLPKPIAHGHGGIVLEHLKSLALHRNVGPSDRMLWITTTGWMMWNVLVGGLLVGATLVLYDGSPELHGPGTIWQLADETETTVLGVSAGFLHRCMRAGLKPGDEWNLTRLRSIGVTASPLSPEAFRWVYRSVKGDIMLAPASGGTDVCSALVGPCPILPVQTGVMQCRMLGAKVEAFDANGHALIGEVGEMVLTAPMPSMPLFFWGDRDGELLRRSYFSIYPGVWRHGDWLRIGADGTCEILGRSDATLNRGGVRMGTAEFYRVIETIAEVKDSLIVDTSGAGRDGQLLLFVEIKQGGLDDELRARIRQVIRRDLSPRHVPDEVIEVPSIPYNRAGKKLEVPIKRILMGESPDAVLAHDTMTNDLAMAPFVELARRLSEPR